MFQETGLIVIDKSDNKLDEDDLMLLALECGAEDFKDEEESYEITCKPGDVQKVKDCLEEQGIVVALSEVTKIPQSTVSLKGKEAEQMLKLMDALEDHDDVQNVYANFEIEEE